MHALTPASLRRPASRLQRLLRLQRAQQPQQSQRLQQPQQSQRLQQLQRLRLRHGSGLGGAAANFALLLACCLPAQAQVQPQAAPLHGLHAPAGFVIAVRPVPLPAAATRLPAVAVGVASALGTFAGALGDEQLAALRGGTDTPWSDMRLNGTVGNNAATNVVTGANIISEGAFSNASGLPMVIQNSGANVLIQNATIVNVQFQ